LVVTWIADPVQAEAAVSALGLDPEAAVEPEPAGVVPLAPAVLPEPAAVVAAEPLAVLVAPDPVDELVQAAVAPRTAVATSAVAAACRMRIIFVKAPQGPRVADHDVRITDVERDDRPPNRLDGVAGADR
jgi:hypothetical protein